MKALLYILLLLPAPAIAIDQAEITGRPFVLLADDGSFSLCGLRFIVFHELNNQAKSQSGLVYDGSMSINTSGQVLLKGSPYRATMDKNGMMKRDQIPLQSYWIKSQGSNATVPYQDKTFPGEDNISLMNFDKDGLDKYSDMISSITEQRPVMIGAAFKNEDTPKVFSGLVQISQADLDSFYNCNVEIAKKITSAPNQ